MFMNSYANSSWYPRIHMFFYEFIYIYIEFIHEFMYEFHKFIYELTI